MYMFLSEIDFIKNREIIACFSCSKKVLVVSVNTYLNITARVKEYFVMTPSRIYYFGEHIFNSSYILNIGE